MSYCYLIHFDRPISDRHTTQHYLGFTSQSVKRRLLAHLQKRGSRLTQVAIERGISFRVVRIWRNGTRSLERQLKNRKEGPYLCPLCNPKLTDYIGYNRSV